MSGLAALLIELGHTVSGSDKANTMETDRLQRLGLRFYEQHRPEHACTADLVVFSSAIKSDNPVTLAPKSRFSERTRTGTHAANILSLKATKATALCAASIPSTPSF